VVVFRNELNRQNKSPRYYPYKSVRSRRSLFLSGFTK
jgi:hypothetical protein